MMLRSERAGHGEGSDWKPSSSNGGVAVLILTKRWREVMMGTIYDDVDKKGARHDGHDSHGE